MNSPIGKASEPWKPTDEESKSALLLSVLRWNTERPSARSRPRSPGSRNEISLLPVSRVVAMSKESRCPRPRKFASEKFRNSPKPESEL